MAKVPGSLAGEAAFKEAERRIAERGEDKGPWLYLGDLHLDRLPAAIAQLTSLEGLQLFGSEISDFSVLSSLSNLDRLEIGSRSPGFADIGFLAGMPNLRHLSILASGPLNLTSLEQCKALESVELRASGDPQPFPGTDALAQLPSLSRLVLGNVLLTDLRIAAAWPALRHLSLSNTGTKSLVGLEQLAGLESVSAMSVPLDDCAALAGATQLEELTLLNVALHECAFLSGLCSLRRLKINHAPLRSIAPLADLAALQRAYRDKRPARERRAKPLETVDLSDTLVDDLEPIANFEHLQRACFARTPITTIAPLFGCTSLRHLDIRETSIADLGPQGGLAKLAWLLASDSKIDSLEALRPGASMLLLSIERTAVSDLSPLERARWCRAVDLNGSQVADLSPLLVVDVMSQPDRGEPDTRLDFRHTPAAFVDEELGRLAHLGERAGAECFVEVQALLKSRIPQETDNSDDAFISSKGKRAARGSVGDLLRSLFDRSGRPRR